MEMENYYTNPISESQNQNQNQTNDIEKKQKVNQNQNQMKQSKNTFFHNWIIFLSGPVLPVFMGVAIGACFKDMINAIVLNIMIPLIVKLLSMSHLNNYYDFSSYLETENNSALNIKQVTSNVFTFLFVTVSIYFVHKFITNYSK